jgi:hypothetical protein
MAADSLPGSTRNLSDSRAEGTYYTPIKSVFVHVPDSDTALQALVSSLAPGQNSSVVKTPSKGDVSKLSDKLKESLGDVDPPQEAAQRNERGEVCTYTGVD